MAGYGFGFRRRARSSVGGGVGASVSSTQWRLLFPAGAEQDTDFNSDMYIRELEMRGEVGGADLTNTIGGTASASHEPSGSSFGAAKAFDGTTGYWANTWQNQDNCWLQFAFAEAVTIEEVQMTFAETTRQPVAFFVQYFDGADWVTYFDSDIEANGSLGGAYATGATDTFSTPWTESEGFARWRLLINDGSDGTEMSFDYVVLSDAAGIRRSYGGAVTSSTTLTGNFSDQKAFDQSTGRWVPDSPRNGNGTWLEYAFFRKEQIAQVSIKATGTNQGPRDVSVQYFDGATWVTDWGFTPAAWTVSGETRTFTKP